MTRAQFAISLSVLTFAALAWLASMLWRAGAQKAVRRG